MEKAKVYFTDFRTKANGDGLPTKLKKLCKKAGIADLDLEGKFVAPILSGVLYDACGMRYTFFPFGAVFVVFSFITMLLVKHGDSRPTEKKSALEQLGGGDD